MTVTYVAASNSDSSPVSSRDPGEPSGAQAGDRIILGACINSQNGVFTAPADMDELDIVETTVGSGSVSIGIWTKVRGADAGSGYAVSYSGTAASMRATAFAFRGTAVFDVTYSNALHFNETSNVPNTASQPITTVTNGAMVFLLQFSALNDISVAGAPSGYDLRFSEVGESQRQIVSATRIVATAGTETPGDWTHTHGGGSDPYNFTFALRPSAISTAGVVLKRIRGF